MPRSYDRDHDTAVLDELAAVDPAVWRAGQSNGIRRHLSVLESQLAERAGASEPLSDAAARAQAELAALECDQPQLQALLAALAPTWTGTVEELLLPVGREALAP